MRILHVTSTYPGPFVADLVAAERSAGLEGDVVAPHRPGQARNEPGLHRFRYGPDQLEVLAGRGGLLASVRRPLGMAMVVPYLASLVVSTVLQGRRTRPDVIHAHWWFPGGLAAAVASRVLGIPYVVTLHGSDVALAGRRGWRGLARMIIGAASVVTADSLALSDDIRLVVPTGAITIAPMPVPLLDRVRSASPTAAPPPIRLVGVGRFAPEKGFDVLVAAVGLLVADGVDVELDLVGDAQPAGPFPHVELRGRVSDEEMHALIGRAHAVVVPSRREGLGLVAVEALALGRPVIASRVGGLVETIEDGVDGVLVPPGDPAALAAAIRRLPLPNPVGARIARHRPDAAAAIHIACYREAAERGVRRWRMGRVVTVVAWGSVLVIARRAARRPS